MIERIAGLHPDADRQEIVNRVGTAQAAFADRPIREFVPLFVELSVLIDLGSNVQIAHTDSLVSVPASLSSPVRCCLDPYLGQEARGVGPVCRKDRPPRQWRTDTGVIIARSLFGRSMFTSGSRRSRPVTATSARH